MKGSMTTFNNLDLELLFCTDVLKLNSLHYGYWNGGEKLNLENLRKGQVTYTKILIDLIPKEVKTILDVGCGIGDIALALAKKGYIVTAISPDRNHKKFFDNPSDKKISFYNKKFEEFNSNQKFNLILMSECQNYFDADLGFRQCRRYLKNGSYLLVSDMFRKKNSKEFKEVMNIEKEYIEKAKNYNLTLVKSIDITKNVLPTLKLANKAYREYFISSLDILRYYFDTLTPVKLKLFKLFFLKEIKQLTRIYKYYDECLDPYLFQKHVKYLRFLFYFK